MPNGSVKITWGDDEHEFNVARIKHALELEEKCSAGVCEIFDRIRYHRWRINDVRETLRIGLIGGGLEPKKALELVTRYCDERPWQESVEPALLVLMAAMVGVPGDDVGKKPATDRPGQEGGEPSSATMASSADPSFTVSPPSLDSRLERPTS